jgi:AcrR family transcriptional regulator
VSSPTRPPDPARRSEQSRQAILSAARDLLAEHGYDGVSIEAIAARAGVGKQTIYRWWRSKGAVMLDSLLELSRDGEGILLPDTGDIDADLRTVMRATVAEFADAAFEAPIRALNLEIIRDPALADQYQERLEAPVHAAKLARLRAAQDAGQLPADADLELAIDLLYAPVFRRWLLRSGPLTGDYADGLVTHVLAALRAV